MTREHGRGDNQGTDLLAPRQQGAEQVEGAEAEHVEQLALVRVRVTVRVTVKVRVRVRVKVTVRV